MGDVLGGIFGSGQRTSQDTEVDPTTRSLNQMRQQQLQRVFDYLYQGGEGGDVYGGSATVAYQPSEQTQNLYNWATAEPDMSNTMTLQDYENSGLGLINEFMGGGLTASQNTAQAGMAETQAQYEDALARGDTRLASAIAARNADYQQMMTDVTDTSQNYVNRIAAPTVSQAMALQGMEGGGALPAAIAQASAEYAAPLVQGLQQQYMGAGTQLQGENMQLASQLAGMNMQQRAQFLRDMSAQQAQLYGQGMQAGTSFMESMPGAARTLSMLPEEMRAARAGTAASLFPMSDYERSLQERNLARRTGLLQTAMTGIPYTPETSTSGRQSSQPLFNFFGQG